MNEDYDYLWAVHSFDVENLNFQLFCFCYSVVNVGSVFTEAQPGSTLTALCFEIAYSLLRKIVEREFQILTLMNFHEPLEIKCNFQWPSSSDSPLTFRSNVPLPLEPLANNASICIGIKCNKYKPEIQSLVLFTLANSRWREVYGLWGIWGH